MSTGSVPESGGSNRRSGLWQRLGLRSRRPNVNPVTIEVEPVGGIQIGQEIRRRPRNTRFFRTRRVSPPRSPHRREVEQTEENLNSEPSARAESNWQDVRALNQTAVFNDFDPVAAVHLMHGFLIAGFVFSMSIPHILFILYSVGFYYWFENGFAAFWDYPVIILLHANLVLHCLIQVCQMNYRIKIYRQVMICKQMLGEFNSNLFNNTRERIRAEMLRLETSREWRRNHALSTKLYFNIFLMISILLLEKLYPAIHTKKNPEKHKLSFFLVLFENDIQRIITWMRFGVTSFDLRSSSYETRMEANYFLIFGAAWLVVALFIGRLLLSSIWSVFKYQQIRGSLGKKGLSKLDIERLTKFEFNENSMKEFKFTLSQCTICLNAFEESEKLIALPCNNKHVFHEECIKQWLKKSSYCPLCMADISMMG